MATVRFRVEDTSGNALAGTTELYINGARQPDIIGGSLVLNNVPVGSHNFYFKYGGDFGCKVCFVTGNVYTDPLPDCIPGGGDVPQIANPCSWNIGIYTDTTIVIGVATPEPPAPVTNCYIGDNVYVIDGCTAKIVSDGSPGSEKTLFPMGGNYRVYVLRTRTDCGGIGGEIASLQYYNDADSLWYPWLTTSTVSGNGYAYVYWDVPANNYTYLRIIWGDCTKQFSQYTVPPPPLKQTLTIDISYRGYRTDFTGTSDKQPGQHSNGNTIDYPFGITERDVTKWAITTTKSTFAGTHTVAGDIIYVNVINGAPTYLGIGFSPGDGLLGLHVDDILYYKGLQVYPVNTNAQVFNLCWGVGLLSPCSIPPEKPNVAPGSTVNIIADIVNNGSQTTIRGVLKADGVVISDTTKYMEPMPTSGIWSISVPYTIPNKSSVELVAEAYSWDGFSYILTNTVTTTINIDLPTSEYFVGDYHNLKTYGNFAIATLDPVEATMEYSRYPMGIVGDVNACATEPNKYITASKSTFVAVLFNMYNLYTSGFVIFDWYRDRDNMLLLSQRVDIPNPADSGYTRFDWYSTWSWLCKIPGGIEEPGAYHVSITSEPYLLMATIPFTLTCSTPVCNLSVT